MPSDKSRIVIRVNLSIAVICCAMLLLPSSGCNLLATTFPPASEFGDTGDIGREIEEADIIKVHNGFFYIANPFTGLRIIDGRMIENPTPMGRLALGGRAVELFVTDDIVFVLTTADSFNCAGELVGIGDSLFDPLVLPDYEGSRLWAIDVRDKLKPTLAASVDFDGFVTATRRVGDVIYAAGNAFQPDPDADIDDIEAAFREGAFVTSINVADPSDVSVVATEFFPGRSQDVHVTEDAMYVFGNDSTIFDTSVITYVDISDPEGRVRIRDQFRLPGSVLDRFAIDAHEGTLRIVTEEFIPSVYAWVVALFIYDVQDPDNIVRLSRLPLVVDGKLRAARFDDHRGYIETSSRSGPLQILDLSDPSDPIIASELERPGFGTKLFPLGDRLIGIGFDNTAGYRPALVLYDVRNLNSPRELSRIIVGDRFAFNSASTATVDEKALRILADAGLILLPISTFDRETGLFDDMVMFIELQESRLDERGSIGHVGFVRRADMVDERVWILSDRAFQTINVDDLDAPSSLAVLDFVSEQELLDGGLFGCANASRRRATEVYGVSTVSPCGILGFMPLLGFFLGFLTFKSRVRYWHRRRVENGRHHSSVRSSRCRVKDPLSQYVEIS